MLLNGGAKKKTNSQRIELAIPAQPRHFSTVWDSGLLPLAPGSRSKHLAGCFS